MKANLKIGLAFAFFFSCLILSFLLFFLFLAQNNLSWSEYWSNTDLYGSISLPKLKFSQGVKTRHEEINFPLLNKINITTDIEDIVFMEEDRGDIFIVYDYRHPNAPEYEISFQAFSTGDEIHITASTKAKSGQDNPLKSSIPDSYRGTISIHLPKGHHLQELDISTAYSNINPESVYKNTDNYFFSTSMGNIRFEIDSPKQMVSLNSDLGNISVFGKSEVHSFDVISNLGNCSLYFKDRVHTLYLMNDFGNSQIACEKKIVGANIQSNVGDIALFLNVLPDFFEVISSNGDIKAFLAENTDSSFKSLSGQIDSYFAGHENDISFYRFYSHTGNIEILKPTPKMLEEFLPNTGKNY